MTESFPIVPGQFRMLWVAVPLLLIALAAIGTLAYSFAGARTARFEVSPAGLRLRGDFYGRLIPASALNLRDARAVNLQTEPALAPVARLVGTAISGYQAGWFRLRNGSRALLYVTDRSRVAYVPTTQGYAVLLSVADPDALLASLQRIAASP
jgi:Bacterial PH domain